MSISVGDKVRRQDFPGRVGTVTGLRTADNGQPNSAIVAWEDGNHSETVLAALEKVA